MDNSNLISVIVPVYNVEQYLSYCIESIVNQTYKNLEIILIDDGSPDNCPKICDEWALKDNRIKVYHLENGGAGKARNIGLSYATGKYISFIDSDDYVSIDFYKTLMSLINDNCDIVECDYTIVHDEECNFSSSEIKNEYKIFTNEEAMELHIKDKIFKQVIWNKLYKYDIIKNIKFPEGNLVDDEFWTYQAIGSAKRLTHINKTLYAYRQQNESVMHSKYSLKWLSAVEAKLKRIEYVRIYYPNLYDISCKDLWFTCLYHGQQSVINLEKKDKKEAFEYLKNIQKKYPISLRSLKNDKLTHKIWLLISKISFKLTCYIRNILNINV